MNDMVPHTDPQPALWKTLIIGAVALLVVVGLIVVMFNLPIVTGDAPH